MRSGLLSIAPVAAEDRAAAELLLTRAFAGTAEERSRDLVRCRRPSTFMPTDWLEPPKCFPRGYFSTAHESCHGLR